MRWHRPGGTGGETYRGPPRTCYKSYCITVTSRSNLSYACEALGDKLGVQCLVQGHLDMRRGRAGDRTANRFPSIVHFYILLYSSCGKECRVAPLGRELWTAFGLHEQNTRRTPPRQGRLKQLWMNCSHSASTTDMMEHGGWAKNIHVGAF